MYVYICNIYNSNLDTLQHLLYCSQGYNINNNQSLKKLFPYKSNEKNQAYRPTIHIRHFCFISRLSSRSASFAFKASTTVLSPILPEALHNPVKTLRLRAQHAKCVHRTVYHYHHHHHQLQGQPTGQLQL